MFWGVSYILQFLSYYLCYLILFRLKLGNWKRCCFVTALICVFSCIMKEIGHHQISTSIIPIFALLGFILWAPRMWKTIVAFFPVPLILTGCVNILLQIFISFSLQIPYSSFLNSMFWSVVTDTLTVGSFWAWYILYAKKTEEVQLGRKDCFVILMGAICLFIVVGVSQGLMKGDASFYLSMNKLFAISVMSLCLFFFIGLLLQVLMKNRAIQYEAEKALYNQFLGQQEAHVKDLLEADERLRMFRHDMRAHLLALESCMEERDEEHAREYLESMKREARASERELYCGVAAVDAIVSEWHKKAQEKDVAWEWKGEFPQDVRLDLFNFCVLISNLLSNAVEAAEKVASEQGRFVRVSLGAMQGKVVVQIVNSCVDSVAKNPNMISTKKDLQNHGFGMKSMERSVEQCHGKMTRSCEDGVFRVRVIV